MSTRADQIVEDARNLRDALRDIARPEWADVIQRLITARAASRGTNQSLTRDFRVLRGLLIRTVPILTTEDGVPQDEWDQLVADIRTALATPYPGLTATTGA